MAQAIGDPDELDNFAQALSQFNETLSEASSQIQGSFSALGDSWQDEKRRSFEECFQELIVSLDRFKEASADQIPYLHHMAERLRDYLQS